jgi:hypothetical protein
LEKIQGGLQFVSPPADIALRRLALDVITLRHRGTGPVTNLPIDPDLPRHDRPLRFLPTLRESTTHQSQIQTNFCFQLFDAPSLTQKSETGREKTGK